MADRVEHAVLPLQETCADIIAELPGDIALEARLDAVNIHDIVRHRELIMAEGRVEEMVVFLQLIV